MCLIISHYFTLGWKWRFFRVNETTWNAFTTGSVKANMKSYIPLETAAKFVLQTFF